MWILCVFFMVPLALLSTLIMNETSIRGHRQSEQLRLDALTLSICHHRKNFLNHEILETNRRIGAIQQTMKATAMPCFLAMTSGNPFASMAVCNSIKQILSKLSLLGVILEQKQNLARQSYIFTQKALIDELTAENKLSHQNGSLQLNFIPLHALRDGLHREQLHKEILMLETFFHTKWPKKLIRTFDFPLFHKVNSVFKPHHNLIGVNDRLNSWEGIKPFHHSSLHGPFAQTMSACEVVQSTHSQFKVQRLW